MRRRSKEKENERPWMAIGSDVVRQIRRHARSSIKTEVCGVLVGHEDGGGMEVEACISGVNAEQAGAHVTFTQDTWEHIYKVKDQQYPNQRIVGWYHSHPGFGIFLSDHDTFIHKNFFSSPKQVAWVCDPHSDEEGCFGWVSGRIERLTQIQIIDRQGGEGAEVGGRPEPVISASEDDELSTGQRWTPEPEASETISLTQLTTTVLSYLSVLLIGFMIGWYFFPRVMVVPVPVDPLTGQPLELRQRESDRPRADSPQNGQAATSNPPAKSGSTDAGKAGHDKQ